MEYSDQGEKNQTKTHSGIVVCEAEGVVSFHLHMITFFKVTTKKDVYHCAYNNAGAVVLI